MITRSLSRNLQKEKSMFGQTAFFCKLFFQIIPILINPVFALCGSTSERPHEPELHPEAASVCGEDEDETAATEEEQEEALMVPQVKVAEDGSLIIDEERSVLKLFAGPFSRVVRW